MLKTITDIVNYLKENRAYRDGIVLIVGMMGIFILTMYLDLESLIGKYFAGSDNKIGNVLIGIMLLTIASVAFSLRRWGELNVEIAERKKAERKLQSNRAQLQAVLDGVPDIILQVDTAMRIVWANKAALDKNPDCIGLACRTAFTAIEGLSIETYCKWAMQTKRIEKGIRFQPAVQKDSDKEKSSNVGDLYWEGIGVPLMLSDGRIFGAIAIARNVTHHMQVEATRKLLASLVESSDDAIIGESLDGVIHSWNSGASRIFGYDANEVLGKKSEVIFGSSGGPIPSIKENLRKGRALESSGSKYSQLMIECQTKLNKKIFTSVTISPIIHPTGNIIGFSTIARDITAQKLAEEALIASEEKYRNLFEHSIEGIGIVVGDMFISANSALLQIFGYDELDEFLSKSLVEHVADEHKPFILDRLRKRRLGEPVSTNYEIKIIRKDGEERYLEVSAGTLRLGDETFIQSTYRDITQRKKADDELKTSREQLRSLATYLEKVREEERKEIAHEIHDDLGQVLTALKIDISWLAKKLDTSQSKLIERSKSMSDLIDDTINKVRTISTQLRPSILDHFGIGAAIEWLAEDFQKRTDISCKITILPKDIELDEFISTGVFRICQEAITNITRHAEATMVDVSLIKSGSDLELKVVDNGIGISEDKVSDINSFGLIGIRERAYLAGGTSKITGYPGEGTTVEVHIPLQV